MSARPSLFRSLVRQPLGLLALVLLATFALLAVIGPWIAPHDPQAASLQDVLMPPSGDHLLGTDPSGRDVLSRLLVGTRASLLGALITLAVAAAVGIPTGLVAGYRRGWVELVLSYFAAAFMAMPAMVILLAARAVIGPNLWWAMVIFGVIVSPAFYRLTLAIVAGVRNELYVDAARASGLSDSRIIGRHILSVVRAPLIVQAAGIASVGIGIQAGLEFLGMGDRELITWGAMLNDGFQVIYRQPWLLVWPSAAIALVSIALALFANALRDVLQRTTPVPRRRERKEQAVAAPRFVATEPAALLSVRDLQVTYDQAGGAEKTVVHGVSFDVWRGEVLGLVGESGSGKTQTAFAILDVLADGGRVSAGVIAVDGVATSATDRAKARGRRIAYIPQEPMSNLDPSFTLGHQLVEPLRRVNGLSAAAAKAKAVALLERVGIVDPVAVMDSYPHQISGGMAQRVLIAGAIAGDPEVLIADEPTTALDVTVQAEVLDLLRDLQAERGMAVVLVTHNFGVVADICDRVAVMKEGSIVETDLVDQIFDHPEHPYTRELLASILDENEVRPAYNAPKDSSQQLSIGGMS